MFLSYDFIIFLSMPFIFSSSWGYLSFNILFSVPIILLHLILIPKGMDFLYINNYHIFNKFNILTPYRFLLLVTDYIIEWRDQGRISYI